MGERLTDEALCELIAFYAAHWPHWSLQDNENACRVLTMIMDYIALRAENVRLRDLLRAYANEVSLWYRGELYPLGQLPTWVREVKRDQVSKR